MQARCPKCGSTDAGADESRSAYDFTFMQCNACGEGGLVDSWERDLEWYLSEAEFAEQGQKPPTYGCDRCFGADSDAAWEGMRSTRVRSLIAESHFGVSITACACGQRYVVVFTERIDWQGGEDPQDWLVLPIDGEELARLASTTEAELPALVTQVGRGRRFLVRSYPTGGGISTWWRESGFAIGPHD